MILNAAFAVFFSPTKFARVPLGFLAMACSFRVFSITKKVGERHLSAIPPHPIFSDDPMILPQKPVSAPSNAPKAMPLYEVRFRRPSETRFRNKMDAFPRTNVGSSIPKQNNAVGFQVWRPKSIIVGFVVLSMRFFSKSWPNIKIAAKR